MRSRKLLAAVPATTTDAPTNGLVCQRWGSPKRAIGSMKWVRARRKGAQGSELGDHSVSQRRFGTGSNIPDAIREIASGIAKSATLARIRHMELRAGHGRPSSSTPHTEVPPRPNQGRCHPMGRRHPVGHRHRTGRRHRWAAAAAGAAAAAAWAAATLPAAPAWAHGVDAPFPTTTSHATTRSEPFPNVRKPHVAASRSPRGAASPWQLRCAPRNSGYLATPAFFQDHPWRSL